MVYGTGSSMPHSQGLSNNHYSEPNQPILIPISLRSILILSSHLCLGHPKGLFPVVVPVKMNYPGLIDSTGLNLSLESNATQDIVVCDTICHHLTGSPGFETWTSRFLATWTTI